MKRLFAEHKIRSVTDLSGAWKFRTDPDGVGEEQGWFRSLPEGETVIVPSVWNNELGLLNYEGLGWYEKKFDTKGGTLRLEFGSVMTVADVWLDGEKLGTHYGAFTQFEFIVPHVDAGEHTLTVRADSRIDAHSFPQRYTDWFNYGGIAREVFADHLEGICILRNRIVYTLNEARTEATLHAELALYNGDGEARTAPLTVTVGEHTVYTGTVTLDGHSETTFITPDVTLADVALWSTETPNLYDVVAATDTDDLRDRIGFRHVEVKDGNILLNGKSVEFRGVNRHEEHPDWGFAFPAKLMKKDIDLMVDLGCNAVRGSHYPQEQIFVDMLDERGLMFWCEIPMWGIGFSEEALADPIIVERGLNMHREMTRYYYNHPSIVIWGMHNEIRTYAAEVSLAVTRKYNEHLRQDGGNRLITHASAFPMGDTSMEYDDIICINMYKGWYHGSPNDWDIFVKEFDEDRKKRGLGDKPMIMSEFGAAALAGFHSHFDTVRWSEEFQSDLISHCLELFHRTDYMRGFFIWQFCNIRTSPSMDINRVRYFNNKGIVDEYRNPKAAYFKVRELYHRFADEEK